MHVNKINCKRYIGLTKQEPNRRWKHGEGYKGSTHFYNAIKKYGWDGFYHFILRMHLSKEEAETMEAQLIKEYNTQNEQFGYNLESGGNAPAHSPETLDKLSKLLKGKKRSEEYCKRMSEERKGKPGHPQSEETKKKISNANKCRVVSDDIKALYKQLYSKPVLCIELNQEYSSAKEAAEAFNLKRVTIQAAVAGRLQTAGGYHWKYVNL